MRQGGESALIAEGGIGIPPYFLRGCLMVESQKVGLPAYGLTIWYESTRSPRLE